MWNKKNFICLLLIILICFTSFSSQTLSFRTKNNQFSTRQTIQSQKNIQKTSYNPVSNITINGNNNLLQQATTNGWAGSGSSGNPIIIRNYFFTSSTSGNTNFLLTYGISITNTSLYISIKDNKLSKNIFIGIYLLLCKNVLISNNSFESNKVSIFQSTSITIKSNNFNQELYPLTILESKDINIEGNNFYALDNNNSSQNALNCTIDLRLNINSYLFSNNFNNCNPNILENPNLRVINNVFNSSLLYLDSSKAVVTYNRFINIKAGIVVEFLLFPNLALVKSIYGSIIEYNLFQGNLNGIKFVNRSSEQVNCPYYLECSQLGTSYSGKTMLHYSNYIIRYNEFKNNINKAIYIGQYNDNNTIYGNDFINNNQSLLNSLNNPKQFTTQVFESKNQNVSNYWSYNKIGNYWSDFNYQDNNNSAIGKVPMYFSENGVDPYPAVGEFNNSYIYPGEPLNILKILEELMVPIIAIIAMAMLLIILSISFIEYKKFKIRVNTNEIPKQSFSKYVKNRIFKIKKKEKELLSNKTFDMIEEIIDENKSS